MKEHKVLYVALALCAAFLISQHSPAAKPPKQATPDLPDTVLEISIGGKVDSIHITAGQVVHIITDENRVLTDVRLISTINGDIGPLIELPAVGAK